MSELTIIKSINSVIETYFNENSSVSIIPAKDLMPDFIKADIFKKNFKNGKPIRDVLRALDRNKELYLIPYVYPERKDADTFWYFIPKGAAAPATLYKQGPVSIKKEEAKQNRLLSDETYVLDMCDSVLGQTSQRQKRFEFLLGDFHKDGVTRTPLPVDAYYEKLNLVIEFKEAQHTDPVISFENRHVKTISGVNRAEQRRIYDERRATVLPKNGINLIEIAYIDFKCDSSNKIIRNPEQDLVKVREMLREV